MQDTAHRFRTTVRFDERVMRHAEQTAATLDVTVARLFEILLVDYTCHGTRLSDASIAPTARPSATVIELNGVRRRRIRKSG